MSMWDYLDENISVLLVMSIDSKTSIFLTETKEFNIGIAFCLGNNKVFRFITLW